MLHPVQTGSAAAGFPTKKPQLEQSQARPGRGPLEIICSVVAMLVPLSPVGSYLCHAFFGGQTRHATWVFFLGDLTARQMRRSCCGNMRSMGEGERVAAEAEVARRSRVMAGLDEVDGAPLEASIVEAMQLLRRGERPGAEPAQPDGDG